jgi:hypothetical protein
LGGDDGGEHPGKPSPEVGEDLSDVVAAGAEDGKEGVAECAFQRASRQAAISFHVADLGFDGAATTEVCDQFRRQPAPCAADQDTGRLNAVAAVSTIDDGEVGALIGEDGYLLQRLPQGVAVVRVARKAAHADHEAFVQRGGNADLAAEFIAHPGLALGYAIHLGFVQGIDLVGPLGCLVQQLRDKGEFGNDAIPQATLGDILQ